MKVLHITSDSYSQEEEYITIDGYSQEEVYNK